MIIKTKEFQDSCKKILEAVDTTSKQMFDETLELKTQNKKLHLNVTNGEYYVTVIFKDVIEEDLHVTVNAKTFLTLISKITTEDLELKVLSNSLNVVANGSYKLPLIYNSSDEMYVPKVISIDNVMTEMTTEGNTLLSILNYNSKELNKGAITRAVQKMFYVDQDGCITFTTGACVNKFTLDKPIKMLLNSKLVRLFKLFERDESVKITFGYDEENGVVQSKVRFESDEVIITSLLSSDETLLNSVPVTAIRKRAYEEYTYNVEIEKNSLLEVLDRLSVFSSDSDNLKLELTPTKLVIKNVKEDSVEYLDYKANVPTESYELFINLKDFKMTVENCNEQFFTMSYGNKQAILITRGFIRNIIPEGHII